MNQKNAKRCGGGTFWINPPQVSGGGGGGLPSDPIVLTAGASASFTLNRAFGLTDGVTVIAIHCGNFGGMGTTDGFLDIGGGADADTMATRLLACLTATFTAVGSDLTAEAGPGSAKVTVSAGATGLLFGSATAGVQAL